MLVLLTEMLARGGATPVPIRLRDAQEGLDFEELAGTKFLSEVDTILLSQSEGDRIWRYLVKLCRGLSLRPLPLPAQERPVLSDRDE